MFLSYDSHLEAGGYPIALPSRLPLPKKDTPDPQWWRASASLTDHLPKQDTPDHARQFHRDRHFNESIS